MSDLNVGTNIYLDVSKVAVNTLTDCNCMDAHVCIVMFNGYIYVWSQRIHWISTAEYFTDPVRNEMTRECRVARGSRMTREQK